MLWIFQTGEPLPYYEETQRMMRCGNLFNWYKAENRQVRIISSLFFHQDKSLRQYLPCTSAHPPIQLIPSPGYKTNISASRFLDHIILALNLARYLLTYRGPLPSICFIGSPPVEFAFVAAFWCKYHKIPFVIDIKDLWPEIFYINLKSPFQSIARLALYPLHLLNKYKLHNCLAVTSISPDFISYLVTQYKIPSKITTINLPLVKPLAQSPSINKTLQSTNILDSIGNTYTNNILFVGNLMESAYLFDPLFEAAELALLHSKPWKFLICGSGPLLGKLKADASNLSNVIFLGRVNQDELHTLAQVSDIGIAPIANRFDYKLSLPNKIIDFFSYGLPVVTSLEGYTSSLINKYCLGETYLPTDHYGCYSAIETLISSPTHLRKTSENVKRFYAANLDYTTIMKRLSAFLDNANLHQY
jgi:glycosyltransferase involved in cell wall biosynthesis